MRKLATIRKINKIVSIPDADLIELCIIDGWQSITTKNTFNVGDKCVYFEVDSFLPVESRYEFLRSSSYKRMGPQDGFRLKTIKLRGQISQGLIMPITDFPEISSELEVGADVTNLLHVILYQTPEQFHMSGSMKGKFPLFISKTDQERIQNLPMLWEIMKDKEFEETEKLDGTSMTVYRIYDREKEEFKVGVCSRNIDLKIDDSNKEQSVYVKFAVDNGLLDWIKNLKIINNSQIAIQGELIGFGIQGNVYQLMDQRFYIFDVYDIDNQRYLDADQRWIYVKLASEISDKIKHVPVIRERVRILEEYPDMKSILDHADGQSLLNSKFLREGCIYKPRGAGGMSFKVVSNKYLLKHGD